jgi:dihydroorotate dehydrogenase
MAAEFARLAEAAAGSGAHLIEANLSCPNVCSAEGDIFLDAGLSRRVAREMRRAAGKTPLLLKAGYFPDRRKLAAFLRAVSGCADGVVIVNGISRKVLNADGSPAFGPGRQVAGILGRSIHDPSLALVRAAVQIIERDRLALEVLAVGGVLEEADAGRYFEAGAAAVLLGGSPMYDPLLAIRFKRSHPEW